MITVVLSKLVAGAQLVRIFMSLILGLAPLAGARIAGAGNDLSPQIALLLFVAGVMTAAGGFALNDVQDMDRDQSVRVKPLLRGDISPASACTFSLIALLIALSISGFLGIEWLAINACQIIFLLTYSRIKRFDGILANAITGLLCASGVLYGSMFSRLQLSALLIIIAATIYVMAREVLKDVLDIDADRNARIRTVATIFGTQVASYTALILNVVGSIIASIALLAFLNLFMACFLTVAIILTTLIVVKQAVRPSRPTLSMALNCSAALMLVVLLISSLPD